MPLLPPSGSGPRERVLASLDGPARHPIHEADRPVYRLMGKFNLYAASVRGVPGQPDHGLQNLVITPAAAHIAALSARTRLGARRVWILLTRSSPVSVYTDFIVMPRWMPPVVSAGVARPDCNSIISSQVYRGLHHTSWAQLRGAPDAWSMLTTALPDAAAGGGPVPIWSGDAVVLAGRWSPRQAARAVELITLPALIGGVVPSVVLPSLSDLSDTLVEEEPNRVRVWLAAREALSRVAERTGGSLAVNGAQVPVQAPRSHPLAGAMSDEQREVLREVLPPEPVRRGRGRPSVDPRLLLEGVLWRERTGLPWQQMPTVLGTHSSVRQYRVRWRGDGTLSALHALLLPYDPQPEEGDLRSSMAGDRALADGGTGSRPVAGSPADSGRDSVQVPHRPVLIETA
ncbi:transposase [Streptomyces sp. NPDC059783]|uniref:transposase n=1 Tax=Streptomyces sp. NPDC059783 TaxID=3346944 RepID=UPI003649AD0F